MALQWVKPWIALVFGLSAAHSETVMIPDMTSIGSLYDSKLQILSAGVSPTHNGQVCSTWGNYHYKTYDGDFFQLPYTCNYVLSSLCKSSSGYEAFNIQLQRGEVDGLPTITKVSLKLDGTFVELANGNVSVNGLHSSNTDVPTLIPTVELDSKFQNQTCGLCGDFNGVQIYDEFIRNGTNCPQQTNETAFTVLGDIVKCGKTDIETCLRSVTLVTPESMMIVIEASGRVFVNKMFSQLPLFMADVRIFQPSTFYIVVHTSYGLRLEVQLTPIMQVYIVASSSHKDKTQGLCGDFNSIQADDFRTINGLVEGTAVTFADTWKNKAGCPDVAQSFEIPCSLSVENERYAKHWCSMLSDREGIFSQCHTEVNPNYYKDVSTRF
ncbi:mucin-5AC-like [Salvelinus sp. IW2-2015]|uniref:mucin-5AC-like n=1 Tax=Salvelinus sp. IW2-2015 TaxID=2691554 RepID=UPI0038D408A6